MNINDIYALPVERIADESCILFLWVTYPMLREGLEVMRSWGFTYKTIGFQWVKTYPKSTHIFVLGLGRWTRGNTECCLIGLKGRPKRIRKDIRQLIVSPLQRHSQKPAEARTRIKELMGDLPAIELFARCEHPGWDCWGNEV